MLISGTMCDLLLISIWCALGLSPVLAQDPVANLPQGRIVGIKAYTEVSATPVEIYYGVPYATPPKGRYRFSAPERHAGWRRTFFAHRIPPHCPHDGDGGNDNYSEDCLYLNIWTPRRSDGKTVPVVVILFSESWIKGGVSLPCQELAAEGVVVVTVNYRLHLLAFFTLRSLSARGNLALLDQYLALLWVRDNIAAFGGDPTAITLLGHSAGADSVLHHITSPRSIGLFQRALIMSPFDIWKAIDEQKVVEASEVERISREVASLLGCNSDTDHEILHCMRERPLSEITSLYSNNTWSRAMQPISDVFLPDSEQFLPNSLLVALSTSKQPNNMQIDVILGANDLEALNDNGVNYEELIKQGASEISNHKIIPESLQLFSLDRLETLPMLKEAVRWEYWKDRTRNVKDVLDNIESLARVESSAKWNAGIALMAARVARRVARLYVYRYSQPAGVDLQGRQYNFTGAVHGSDLVSLLGDALMLQVARRPATQDEKRVSLLLRRQIINFIKFGSPAEEGVWQRYKTGDANIHDIRDARSVNANYHSADRDVKFWLQYLPQLYNILNSAEKTGKLTDKKGTSAHDIGMCPNEENNCCTVVSTRRAWNEKRGRYSKCTRSHHDAAGNLVHLSPHRENRLRGGVFAMCGVTIVLLLLLFVCAIILHRQKSRRFAVDDENHH